MSSHKSITHKNVFLKKTVFLKGKLPLSSTKDRFYESRNLRHRGFFVIIPIHSVPLTNIESHKSRLTYLKNRENVSVCVSWSSFFVSAFILVKHPIFYSIYGRILLYFSWNILDTINMCVILLQIERKRIFSSYGLANHFCHTKAVQQTFFLRILHEGKCTLSPFGLSIVGNS